ncbi:hypothetical protein BDR04DRAFT_981664, partial [Suillus decipiens]
EKFLVKHGKHKAFHLSSNSSCHQHICSHYNLYKTECSKLGICKNNHAIPQELLKKQ